jgi:hypothetical protein
MHPDPRAPVEILLIVSGSGAVTFWLLAIPKLTAHALAANQHHQARGQPAADRRHTTAGRMALGRPMAAWRGLD